MEFKNFFNRNRAVSTSLPSVHREFTEAGIVFALAAPIAEPSVSLLEVAVFAAPQDDFPLLHGLLQLAQQGMASIETTAVTVLWEHMYRLLVQPEYAPLIGAFDLPAQRQLQPVLINHATLSDQAFSLTVTGWELNGKPICATKQNGAVITIDEQPSLLTPAAWHTIKAIRIFNARAETDRSQHANELAWGKIRTIADKANAVYATPYLATTFVLTPDKLRLTQKKEDTAFGRVHTIVPTFEGAPDDWLRAFDQYKSVQSHYDLKPSGKIKGHLRIILSEEVKQVLQVIKREMPGRKVSGTKAQKFLRNPWAYLGESAVAVLDEETFIRDSIDAGPSATVFSIAPSYEDCRIKSVEVVVAEHFGDGTSRTASIPFLSAFELAKFNDALESALKREVEQFPWEEFDLSIDQESAGELEKSQILSRVWSTQPDARIAFDDVYTISGYSERIHGIGVAKPIYVPLVQKPRREDEEDNGWLPNDLTPLVSVTLAGHDGQVIIPLTHEWVREFEDRVGQAEQNMQESVSDKRLPTPLATQDARALADSFRTMMGAQANVKVDAGGDESQKRPPKESLLVRTNFNDIDYQEERRASLTLLDSAKATPPRTLRPSISLKRHQLKGVAWLQNLVAHSPTDCRGALLADDMGLGKTLQLLTVLGRFYEQNPKGDPTLIIAPKSLLENWAREIERFFTPSFPTHLILHDQTLRDRKQPLNLIADELQEKGITDLLKPNWLGDKKLVISTYEVLTSYEFTLAKQNFAFVICDEAQRIKTPGTRVTLAAKKLKADFRIACTGTPVENSLADLWCLFDFVQPGLLGSLEAFGKEYRRPIECNTDELQNSLARLQALIGPQTLRRTKEDISDELKKKYFVLKNVSEGRPYLSPTPKEEERLEIALSNHQHVLYNSGLKKLQDANAEKDALQRARLTFGALHFMKAVCAEPYCLPGNKFLPDTQGLSTHLKNSPKMRWLLEQLASVAEKGEKAIVFTELREVQTALTFFIYKQFSIRALVINGDTKERQDYIDRFSKKAGFNVIVLSTLAAGAGLNVTAANHVFHFTRAWNAAKENQATDRAYRIGQEKDVFVYCPTVVANFKTFEVNLDAMLKRKGQLAGATIKSPSAMESMLNGSLENVSISELTTGQVDAEQTEKRFITMDDVDRLDGISFEYFCRLLWQKRGYVAEVTEKKRGDGGIDVIALNGKNGELLQCKSSVSSDLGWDAIKEVTGGAAQYQRRYAGTKFRKLCVTNRRFNANAEAQAAANRVHLVQRSDLDKMLTQHPVSSDELENELLTI